MATDKVAHITERLLAPGFKSKATQVAALSDPVADTGMVLTLDQMLPYDSNPRTTRNPLYDEIKESIRQRGLDTPPAVTRRPDEEKYRIRNGGNTRLAILNELYQETNEDRFYRVHCLFRPWHQERGEIISLTGHLAENDMHGQLLFIERALGIEQARKLYEEESGNPIGMRELSRKLTADGYPVSHSHISRMQDAIRFLLPAAPHLLYSGLGANRIIKLLALRKSADTCWNEHYKGEAVEFDMLFGDVLSSFDGEADEFLLERFQDELIGQMRKSLPHVTYENILFGIKQQDDQNRRNNAVTDTAPALPPSPLSPLQTLPPSKPAPTPTSAGPQEPNTGGNGSPQSAAPAPSLPPPSPPGSLEQNSGASPAPIRVDKTQQTLAPPAADAMSAEQQQARIDGHIVSPANISERVMTLKQRLASMNGESLPDFNANCLTAIPVQAGGLHPITDLWYIEGDIDTPRHLRTQIANLAAEIALSVNAPGEIEATGSGIGFLYVSPQEQADLSFVAQHTLTLLQSLSGSVAIALKMMNPTPDGDLSVLGEFQFAAALGQILLGIPPSAEQSAENGERLSDGGLVKLFRIIRLARRLIDLEVATHSTDVDS